MDDMKTPPEPVSDAWDGGMDVQGPTMRQELFLRRQGLWSENLSPADASWLIDQRLKELRDRRVKTSV